MNITTRLKLFLLDIIILIIPVSIFGYILYSKNIENIHVQYEVHFIELLDESFVEVSSEKFKISSDLYRAVIILSKNMHEDYELSIGKELPSIDYSDYNLILSWGRELKAVTYQEVNKKDWSLDEPHAVAHYSEIFKKNRIYIYKIKARSGVRMFGI